MRTLIVDDESHCRSELRHLLLGFPQIEVIGEAINGIDALEKCRSLSPELVFLDIQMPGLNGLEVAAALEELPQIVFVTAYDEHALKAFEVGAIDYLLKPISEERLEQCINRLNRQRITLTTNNSMPVELETVLKTWAEAKQEYLARIVGRKSQRIFVLPIEQIYCFEIESQLLHAITEKEKFWTNYQMKTLELRLDPKQFVRVHRESIVNINFIREIAPITKERYEITLHNNYKVGVSRNYLPQIKDMLEWA
ncbi:MAG: LytTR family transcriptional regulator DNA-binding domain-containing protein [Acidobacteria bacterium]|nr:LytTR family transcriptional regulator DNA-binding domain-containing protein [Acidobacteriota bacterium]